MYITIRRVSVMDGLPLVWFIMIPKARIRYLMIRYMLLYDTVWYSLASNQYVCDQLASLFKYLHFRCERFFYVSILLKQSISCIFMTKALIKSIDSSWFFSDGSLICHQKYIYLCLYIGIPLVVCSIILNFSGTETTARLMIHIPDSLRLNI